MSDLERDNLLLKEQLRVADKAYNFLHQRYQELEWALLQVTTEQTVAYMLEMKDQPRKT